MRKEGKRKESWAGLQRREMRRGRGAGLRKEMGQQAESRERGRNGIFPFSSFFKPDFKCIFKWFLNLFTFG
jgi:hypothetical protein